VEPALREATLVALARVMSLNAELKQAVGGLTAAGLPVIVLKGPVLARTLYPDAALRSYGDIDLMVQDRHEHAAAAALLGCGFTEVSYGPEESRRERAPHVHEGAALHRKFVMWRGEAAHAVIDLHPDPL